MANKYCPCCKGSGIKEIYDHHLQWLITVRCNCKKLVGGRA